MSKQRKFAVTTICYDDGSIEARMTKEEDKPGSYNAYDLYIDEFDTEDEASDYLEETRYA